MYLTTERRRIELVGIVSLRGRLRERERDREREKERERERERERDRQTDRQIDRGAERQRQRGRQRDREERENGFKISRMRGTRKRLRNMHVIINISSFTRPTSEHF